MPSDWLMPPRNCIRAKRKPRIALGVRWNINQNRLDPSKFQTYNTHMKPGKSGFASERSAMSACRGCNEVSKGKFEALYCVLVVAAAVLMGIARCTTCRGPRLP